MKIIQLVYSLSSGGAERFVVSLSNQLTNMGHQVTLCMLLDEQNEKLTFNKQFLKKSVKFYSMRFDRGFSLSKMIKVESFIKQESPDIVHCHLNVIPYIFRLAFFNKKIKFFHTLHNIASKASGLKCQYWINKYFYSQKLIHPVTISNQCQISYRNFYHLDNVPCIDNGCLPVVPTEYFPRVLAEVTGYKVSPDTSVFVHVARFNKQKNQHILIESFNRLNQEGIDFILLVIGNNFDSEDGWILQKKACCRIHFLGEKHNAGDYMLCADAFCLTSLYEGMPVSLLEALSCGVTPVCTAVGGIPDVIDDGKYGYLSDDINVESYKVAIERFLFRKLDKNTLVEYFNNNYSIQICANKYYILYGCEFFCM